ncbi:MAG: type VI secretion system baseplate subunit TssG [Stellaceae bacterium]
MIDRLLRRPHAFSFFQAVRLLDRWQRREQRDGLAQPGADPTAQRKVEPALFRAEVSLGFPPSEIADIRHIEENGTQQRHLVEMIVSFFGLTGPSGVLPQHYTSRLIAKRSESGALRDFLDLFNHRLITLFAEIWAKYRLPIAYERSDRPAEDPITTSLWAMVGMLGDEYGAGSVRDRWLLFYSGMFVHAQRSVAGLEGLLQEYFQLPVKVHQFRGRWLQLGADECSVLPGLYNVNDSYCQLGETATLGDRIWDVRSCFLISIGPLSFPAFRRFMPSGSDLPRLSKLVRLYIGRSLDFDVQLILQRDHVPSCRLSEDDDFSPQIGWNTWLSSDQRVVDVGDPIFAGDAIAR